jgi:hypothetical protein
MAPPVERQLVQNLTTIEKIPIEIKMIIFKELLGKYSDMISVVCLGLASPTLYPVLKALFLIRPVSDRSLNLRSTFRLATVSEILFKFLWSSTQPPDLEDGHMILKISQGRCHIIFGC